jgi:Zn-finger nucleic acid-binding protein
MKCPIDNAELQMTERQNIEIDYCPQCRGVWLDRGELDKLIEKSSDKLQSAQQGHRVDPSYNQNNSHNNHGYKKQKSWLGEIFD